MSFGILKARRIVVTLLCPSVVVSQVLLGWKYGDGVDEKAKTHPQLRTYKALTEKVQYCLLNVRFGKRYPRDFNFQAQSLFPFLLQEKEIYRWPIRESLKSMLAMGWSIDRTKDGESMSQQRENEKMRKISQTSQVQCETYVLDKHQIVLLYYSSPSLKLTWIHFY